eukprot:TRINITY_DN2040_c0_g1_i1.p1 TRINITY_DN2040_c0_g1~~TRINITY_DN2040_c0_g1_i1.p1  ORF type:complete len:407 (+),score=89.05 TRINITY_DN2040_c0_g1_i1:29-1249(+)
MKLSLPRDVTPTELEQYCFKYLERGDWRNFVPYFIKDLTFLIQNSSSNKWNHHCSLQELLNWRNFVMNCFANRLLSIGCPQQAIEVLNDAKKSLVEYKDSISLGKFRHLLAVSDCNMSFCYLKLNDLGKAAFYISKAIERDSVEFCGELSYCGTLIQKASIESLQNQHQQAISTLTNAMELITSKKVSVNSETELESWGEMLVTIQYNIAVEFEHLQDIESAETSFAQALAFAEDHLSQKHPIRQEIVRVVYQSNKTGIIKRSSCKKKKTTDHVEAVPNLNLSDLPGTSQTDVAKIRDERRLKKNQGSTSYQALSSYRSKAKTRKTYIVPETSVNTFHTDPVRVRATKEVYAEMNRTQARESRESRLSRISTPTDHSRSESSNMEKNKSKSRKNSLSTPIKAVKNK